MSESGYKRMAQDSYYTPGWVTRCILPHLERDEYYIDPAYGEGHILEAVSAYMPETSLHFFGWDIEEPVAEVCTPGLLTIGDFLTTETYNQNPDWKPTFITNPPYGQGGRTGVAFIERCLSLSHRQIAMLLPVDFDSGKTRRHLFEHPTFALKGILLKRIQWANLKHTASPKKNHAWYVWNAKHKGPAPIIYLHPNDGVSYERA